MACPICSWSPADPKYILLFESDHWRVVLAENQSLIGRCVLHLKRHSRDVADTTPDELLDWLNAVKTLEKALRTAFGATLFNWSCYMNLSYRENPPEPHVHWWAVQRYNHRVELENWVFEDPQFGSPYDHSRWIEIPDDIRRKIAEKIIQALEKLHGG